MSKHDSSSFVWYTDNMRDEKLARLSRQVGYKPSIRVNLIAIVSIIALTAISLIHWKQ